MSYPSKTLVVIGLGLIGGSLAMALRKSGFCERFVGYGYRTPSLEKGVELGIIDEYTLDIEQALDLADILVVATPTLVASQILEQILPALNGRTKTPVITDVASVKGSIEATAKAVCGQVPPQLVLGHPIAGSERSGVTAAKDNLYVDHRVILTPLANNDPEAVDLIRRMWVSTGADVVDMTVERHDSVLAATSHLPHVLAYALVDALAQGDASEEVFQFAAGGFRDFTRIASSDPVMWKDIALANRDALLAALDMFTDRLSEMREDIAMGHGDQLLQTFARAKQARDEFAALLAARSAPKP